MINYKVVLLKSEGKSAYSLALRFFRNNYCNSFKNEKYFRDFPGGQVVKTLLPVQEVLVQPLVEGLRYHMPHRAEKTKM